MDKEVIDKAIAERRGREEGRHPRQGHDAVSARQDQGPDRRRQLDSNIQLVFNNARLGAAAAVELSKLEK